MSTPMLYGLGYADSRRVGIKTKVWARDLIHGDERYGEMKYVDQTLLHHAYNFSSGRSGRNGVEI